MEPSQVRTLVGLVLLCFLPWSSALPLAAYKPSSATGISNTYPGFFYSAYPGQQAVAYPYVPSPLPKSGNNKESAGVSDLKGVPNQGYIVAPYPMPVPQYRSPVVGDSSDGKLPSGVQYLYYPPGSEYFRDERPTFIETISNFFSNLRPANRPDRPNRPVAFLNPLNWFGGNQENNIVNPPFLPIAEEELGTLGGGGVAQPAGINEVVPELVQKPVVVEEEKPAEEAEEKPAEEAEEKPAEVAAETPDDQVPAEQQPADEDEPQELETVQEAFVEPQVSQEDAEAQAAEITSRILRRNQYLPVVGIPRNVPNRRVGVREAGSSGSGTESGSSPAGEEDVGEQEEDDEEGDTVVIGPGGSNPSVAQAKPAAIALAGVGGVAAAAPSATAVVGANGLAVSAPSATAIAGPSAGAPPPGLLPKVPTQRVPGHKVSAEEARRNAALIQAARRQAQLLASGLGNLRSSSYPSLPYMAYQVWKDEDYGLN